MPKVRTTVRAGSARAPTEPRRDDGAAVTTRRASIAFWLVTSSALLLLRVPYLVSPHHILDGDEAIVGLMAWHMAQARELPVFFWGQAYGFSLLETLPAALAFRLFGPQPLVLSLTMVALFLAALPLYARAFERLTGSVAWARVLTVALSALPVWIVWSFKARGGYLTAFLLLAVLLWLMTRERISRLAWACAGAAIGLLFLAQPLWLAAALPLLGLGVRAHPPPRSTHERLNPLLALVTLVATAGLVRAVWAPANPYWNPNVFDGFSLARVLSLPQQLHRLFTGFFYLGEVLTPPFFVALIGTIATLVFFACAIGLLLEFARSDKRQPAHNTRHSPLGPPTPRPVVTPLLVAATMVATLAPVAVLRTMAPRYLLSSSVLLVVGLATWIGSRGVRFTGAVRASALAALVLLGVSALEMRHFRFQSPTTQSDVETELRNLIQTLHVHNVQGVYSLSGLLQWQIMFYGRESIPARFTSPIDRYPAYPQRVDAARAAGARTALVGQSSSAAPFLASPLRDRLIPVGTDYFIILDPTRDILEAIGFKFQN